MTDISKDISSQKPKEDNGGETKRPEGGNEGDKWVSLGQYPAVDLPWIKFLHSRASLVSLKMPLKGGIMNKIVDLRLGGALIPAERRGAATSTTRDCVQTPNLPLCIIIIPTISDELNRRIEQIFPHSGVAMILHCRIYKHSRFSCCHFCFLDCFFYPMYNTQVPKGNQTRFQKINVLIMNHCHLTGSLTSQKVIAVHLTLVLEKGCARNAAIHFFTDSNSGSGLC